MTRTLSTALLALALGFGAPALAQEDAQLRQSAEATLNEYGYSGVNVDALTSEQLAEFQTLEQQDVDNPADAQRRIDEILVMDSGSAMFVSEEMRALMEEPEYPELRRNARTILGEAGYDAAIADGLSVEQLAQLWFLQERDSDENDPAMIENRIQSILD